MKFSTVVLLCLGLASVGAFADCHVGSDIVVSLASPSSSRTYATPLHFQASATSAHTITGYVVYTNATGTYTNAYQNNNRTTLNAWVILPLTSSGGARSQSVFVRAWNSAGYCGDSTFFLSTRPALKYRRHCPGHRRG